MARQDRVMAETSVRLLRLLALLQTARTWTGPELSERLAVSERTVRNDIARLRELGYPVHASRGSVGGYRLGAGAALPPLVLDDEEAVAVAVGLRTVAVGSIAGIDESAARALAKVEQMLPSALRRRVAALRTYTLPVPPDHAEPGVDPELLAALTAACRDHQRLRFDYRAHDGTVSRRDAEPHRLVTWGRRWYLVAWDTGAQDWRTFRVDRIELHPPHGPRFTARDLPADDLATYVARGVGRAASSHRARILVHAPAAEVAALLPAAVGPVEAVDALTCVVSAGAESVEMLAVWVGMLEADVEVLDSPELVARLRTVAERYQRAVDAATDPR